MTRAVGYILLYLAFLAAVAAASVAFAVTQSNVPPPPNATRPLVPCDDRWRPHIGYACWVTPA